MNMKRLFWERAAQPCGCRFPLDPGNLCPIGQALYVAETAARNAWLANRGDPRAQEAYAAARRAYDRHVGLDSIVEIQESS